ncbi:MULTISPECIES: hypothetical protein [Caproicibacterium]|uniref:Uncharacterized protein n=1 Tax=Caproicibacterium argilliputei TaxID=3030016 RepID=A0AA97H1K5_9FIRM|nr:hypothetical protein [Caproicibacterium argilliputei]WOC31412.1 hypothetical protein PXC00_09290 [Caproicibacterium argilliputei]
MAQFLAGFLHLAGNSKEKPRKRLNKYKQNDKMIYQDSFKYEQIVTDKISKTTKLLVFDQREGR